MHASLIESEDEHHWVLLDHRVTEVHVTARVVRLRTWSLDGSVELSLSTPFVVRLGSGAAKTLDPSRPESLAPLLALVGKPVQSLTISRKGDATVAFDDGVTIEAGRDPRVVSWELLGGGILEGLGYRSAPGVDSW
jgi:hypothetical protein